MKKCFVKVVCWYAYTILSKYEKSVIKLFHFRKITILLGKKQKLTFSISFCFHFKLFSPQR